METEGLSEADRVAANSDALDAVGREIAILERGFAELEKLDGERARLTSVVETLIAEETATLAETTLSEAVAVKRLIEVRAKKDLQSGRLANTQAKIKEQTASLSLQGEAVRKALQFVVGRLYVSRETRMMATLTELFGGDWIILRDGKRLEMRHLAKQTRLMKQARDLDVKLSHPITDPQQEEFAMRHRLRAWLTELTDIVIREPQLVLRNVSADQQQPISQPQMVAA